jgi:outer membrane protein assembly factor BamB
MFNSVSIGKDGTVYTALPTTTQINTMYALNPSDGSVKWEVDTDFYLEGTPAVADDGTVYVGTFAKDIPENAGIYAIKDGVILWYFETEDSTESMCTPAIGSDGTIYFGADDSKFYAISPEGKELWQYKTSGMIESSPAIGAEGTIYIGSSNVPEGGASFYALNSDGTLKWTNSGNSNSIVSSPAIGADGSIYVGSYGGIFYAFGEPKEGKGIIEQNIPALKHDDGKGGSWNPKDDEVDCFEPEGPEIEEKCDMYCHDSPEECPDYFEKKGKKGDSSDKTI